MSNISKNTVLLNKEVSCADATVQELGDAKQAMYIGYCIIEIYALISQSEPGRNNTEEVLHTL